jgi:hypothetical protein
MYEISFNWGSFQRDDTDPRPGESYSAGERLKSGVEFIAG